MSLCSRLLFAGSSRFSISDIGALREIVIADHNCLLISPSRHNGLAVNEYSGRDFKGFAGEVVGGIAA